METLNRYHSELISFHYVAENKSFTKGSLELGMSKSQVSKHVKQIEVLFGAQLINRTTRIFHLTQEGESLYRYTTKLVALTNNASSELKGLVEDDHGELKFSTAPSIGNFIASDIANAFKKEFPNTHLQLDFTQNYRDFNKGEVDIALRVNSVSDPDLIAKYMGNWKEAICISPKLLKSLNIQDNSPEQLAQLPCIINSCIKGHSNWYFYKGKKETAVPVKGPISTSTFESARTFCLDGHGIARIPYFLVHKDIKDKKLIQLFPEHNITGNSMYMVYPRQSYMNKKQRKLNTLLLRLQINFSNNERQRS
jgi:DNA-binding transcriptional LysR family regulator